jgi:hypothetical protein
MTASDRQKKRPNPTAGFDTVPKILDEARRAVDEVTQAAGGREVQTPAVPLTPPASTSTPAPAPPEPLAAPAAPVPEGPRAPLRTPDYYGIRIRHRLKGRIRLRIRRMKWNQGLAEKMQTGLAGVQGIAEVEASAATGSLLLVFDPQTLAAPGCRRDFAALLEGFFPGLDGDTLIRKFL